jgi:hypothetical protein
MAFASHIQSLSKGLENRLQYMMLILTIINIDVKVQPPVNAEGPEKLFGKVGVKGALVTDG